MKAKVVSYVFVTVQELADFGQNFLYGIQLPMLTVCDCSSVLPESSVHHMVVQAVGSPDQVIQFLEAFTLRRAESSSVLMYIGRLSVCTRDRLLVKGDLKTFVRHAVLRPMYKIREMLKQSDYGVTSTDQLLMRWSVAGDQ